MLPSPSILLQYLVIGLSMGLVYALMGLGLTLILGVMKLLNFAHGEFYMLGGYINYYLITSFGAPVYLAVPLSILSTALIGMAVERLTIRPMYFVEKPGDYVLVVTFALSIFFKQLALTLFGPFFKKPPDYLPGILEFGPVRISGNLFVALIVSVAVIFGVIVILRKTYVGRAWRAMAQNVIVAKLSGVNVYRMNMYVFGLSTATAAAAGVFLTSIYLLFPDAGVFPLIKGYIIIAIGGMGSIGGSLIGGTVLGLVETFGSAFIATEYKDIFGFILLILFLTIRPRGILGEKLELVGG